jgi:hypothetical protein
VRAGMVRRAAGYRSSSAALHLAGQDESGTLDMEWWRPRPAADWDPSLNAEGLESDSARQGSHSSG